MNNSPEIDLLLKEVSKVFGKDIAVSSDFDNLAESIEAKVGCMLSVSTLKRLWGYVTSNPKPRYATLDALAKYTGRESYLKFVLELQETSGFIVTEKVLAKDLEPGTVVVVGWMPDRTVELEYRQDNTFEVKDAGTSKLKEGDLLEVSEFLKGQPMYVGRVIRDGQECPAYVAGKSQGLTSIHVF